MIFKRKRRSDTVPTWPPGWDLPERFVLPRDVVEVRGRDISARALTYVDPEGIVDRRTFNEVAHDAARWAQLLRQRVKVPGETVIVATGSVPETVLALLGALKGGLVAAPVGSRLSASELRSRISASSARVIVADRSSEETIAAALDGMSSPPVPVFLDDAASELRTFGPKAPTEDRGLLDPAILLFTAGIADEPKAVLHGHAAIWASRVTAEQWLGADDRDLVWATAAAGTPEWLWHGVLGPWMVGAEIVLHDAAFDAEERFGLLQRLAVTVLCQSPTEYRAIAAVGATVPGALRRLRETVSTGEPLDAALVDAYAEGGKQLRDGLVQAECALLAATLAGAEPVPGVLGVGLPGQDVAVIDGEGHVLGSGHEGELALLGRPPTLFLGYLSDRDTAAAFLDGWYLTGDRVAAEDNDAIRYVGRGDDLIVSGGTRIGPAEVEDLLRTHALVADVVAVPSPDDARGAVVKAFVVLAPGAAPGADLLATLAAHAAASGSPHLAPAAVEVVDALPTAASGQVRRGELRRLERERAAAAAAERERVARAEAEAAEAERARWLAEREEERKKELEAERVRAEEERQRLLREEEARKREERRERERLEQEAKERATAEREERAAAERAEKERQRAEREAAKKAESERKQQEKLAEEQRKVEAAAAKKAESDRKQQEKLDQEKRDAEAREREAAMKAEADAAKRAELERKHQEKLAQEKSEAEAREREAAAHAEAAAGAKAAAEAAAKAEAAANAEAETAKLAELERKQREREAAAQAEAATRAQADAAAKAEAEAAARARALAKEKAEAAARTEEARRPAPRPEPKPAPAQAPTAAAPVVAQRPATERDPEQERLEQERLERERRVRERAEREAARRAAEELRRQRAEERAATPIEVIVPPPAPSATPKPQAQPQPQPVRPPQPEQKPVPQPEPKPQRKPEPEPIAASAKGKSKTSETPSDESDISGLAERIRRYANVDEPSDERPFGWSRADPEPDEDGL